MESFLPVIFTCAKTMLCSDNVNLNKNWADWFFFSDSTCVGMYCCSLHFANFRKLSTVWELTQIKDMHWSSIYTLHKGRSIFLVVIFSSPRTINLCRNKSSFTFWKKKFNKVSDKLLGQLLVLPAAKLKTACTKLVFVPRSLWSNLEQNLNISFEGDITRYLLWGRGKINIEFLNLGQPLT